MARMDPRLTTEDLATAWLVAARSLYPRKRPAQDPFAPTVCAGEVMRATDDMTRDIGDAAIVTKSEDAMRLAQLPATTDEMRELLERVVGDAVRLVPSCRRLTGRNALAWGMANTKRCVLGKTPDVAFDEALAMTGDELVACTRALYVSMSCRPTEYPEGGVIWPDPAMTAATRLAMELVVMRKYGNQDKRD